MLEYVIRAIRQKDMIYLDYPPGIRLIEPHAVGYGSDGQLLLRAFQVSGATASGASRSWKLFRLDRVEQILPAKFVFSAPEQGYRRGDPAMTRGIIVEL
ncbi:hypothetical protein [Methylopila turkensis]|uniref:WYL domain-containing protein n=1 Tax=Methylopila turkensis TaxID=1437816 RepID=A0A9W6JSD4_9HYPH|nr:hypothetical protein [Methylopila turkensis]GLK80929.1 hypothetical protein GCM10008174_26700 [Methylopila turkensis]